METTMTILFKDKFAMGIQIGEKPSEFTTLLAFFFLPLQLLHPLTFWPVTSCLAKAQSKARVEATIPSGATPAENACIHGRVTRFGWKRPPNSVCYVSCRHCPALAGCVNFSSLLYHPWGGAQRPREVFYFFFHFHSPSGTFTDWHLIKRAGRLQTGHATGCMLIAEA